MKIKKIKSFKSELLKLQLINSKIYKKNQNNTTNISLEHIELCLKKGFQIIYKYHLNNKKIFFIGIPSNFQNKFSKIFKKTKHLAIPESIWIKGILSNKHAIFQFLKLKRLKYMKKQNDQTRNIKICLNIKKKPDLIVIINPKLEKNVVNEASHLKIPIIALNSNFKTPIAYPIPGNFNIINKNLHNIVFLLLSSLLKKNNNNKKHDFYKKKT